MFITLEGTEGSGKTTQAQHAVAALRTEGYDVLLTREPGGTLIGDEIRKILLEHRSDSIMHPHTELLLFCASRAQLVEEIIQPFLAKGGVVICDRYADSTMAYQGYGHGLNKTLLKRILEFATGGLKPDLTLFFDLKPEIGLERRQRARLFNQEEWNRLDDMELAFHRRVYKGYEALIKADPKRWARINADQDVAKVQEQVKTTLKARLRQHKHSN